MRLALLLLVVACSGSTPRLPDGPDVCAGALYDPCDSEHNCENGDCLPFATESIVVCTMACSASSPCPKTASGSAVTCDSATSSCEPPAANKCEIAGQ
jgi:hypothetical protein